VHATTRRPSAECIGAASAHRSATSDDSITAPYRRAVNERPETGYCIDLSAAAQERAGLGRYASSLAEALLRLGVPLRAFVNDDRASRLQPPLRDLPTSSVRLPRKGWRLRAAASYFGVRPPDDAFDGIRVFHATEHVLPKLTHARSVFTVHDIAYLRFPEYHLPRNRWYLKAMMPRFLRRADRVIAVSENTRRDVLATYELDPERVVVIAEGVGERFRPHADADTIDAVRVRYGLPERFIAYVGTIEPRKNLPTLFDAYAALRQVHPAVGLVVVGSMGWLFRDVFARVHALGIQRDVAFTGHASDDDVVAILNAATVFAFPSEFEGFGLPPLEAMACGTPVVCSDAASLPEVVGDAGILVPPHDIGAWVEALGRVIEDESLRMRLRSLGLERARRFTWDAAARATLDVYRAAAGALGPSDPMP